MEGNPILEFLKLYWYGLLLGGVLVYLLLFNETVKAWVDAAIEHGLKAIVSILARPPLAALLVFGILVTGIVSVLALMGLINWVLSIGWDEILETIKNAKPFWE